MSVSYTHLIEVTGTWFNRLVYDAGRDPGERKTWVIRWPSPDEPLRDSGLLGPVPVSYTHLHDAGAEPLRGEEILDITSCFDGRKLVWDAPEGEWTVIRYAWTCTGARTSTTSDGWEGLSLDHLDPEAFALYRDSVLLPLIRTAKEAGNSVRFLLTDSWEMGLVNWTERFLEEFRRFRGYDLWRYLPVMTGRVVESPEVSNRFCLLYTSRCV